MRAHSSPRGFSLAEAAVALALLVSGVILSATLFQSVLGYGRRVETRLQAAYLARNALVQVREWLRDPAHFENPGAFALDNSGVDGFEISVQLTPMTTTSPNSSFEMYFSQPREMTSSFLRVEVMVSREGMEFPTISVVGAPKRALATNAVQLEKADGSTLDLSMAPNASQTLRAKLVDSAGREIPDVFFQWSVRPIDGVATLSGISRDGREASLSNVCKKKDGTVIYTGGTCKVGAGTVYGGVDTWSFSDPINLGTP